MNYLYEALDKPTRLYIKQCPHCGLKYFGMSTKSNIERYHGSGVKWRRHLEKHDVKPNHLWNSDWYYDKSISRFALKFSRINRIVESSKWANLVEEDGLTGGNKLTDDIIEKMLSKTDQKKKGTKISETKNSKEWKNTKGKIIDQKRKDTLNSAEWKETIGKESIEKQLKTKSDPIWWETVGKPSRQEARKNTDYSKVGKSVSKKRNDPEWRAKNFKTCPHCKWYGDPGNYAKHHGDNCKKTVEQG